MVQGGSDQAPNRPRAGNPGPYRKGFIVYQPSKATLARLPESRPSADPSSCVALGKLICLCFLS